jgi:penicillin-binding protein 2
MRAETSGIRLSVLGVTVLGLFSALFARLWFLQVAASPGLEKAVVSARIRTVPLLPQRGRIYDREGRILADNRRTLVVVVDQSSIRNKDKRAELFLRLAGALQVQPSELEDRYQSEKYNRLLPLPVMENVTETVAGYLAERQALYPCVSVVAKTSRTYRYSPTGSQIVGYLGQIQAEDAASFKEKGYTADEIVGVAGAEKSFESILRGKPGSKTVEVDSLNRVVRETNRVEPEPGADIQLTIDLKLQMYAEQLVKANLIDRRTQTPGQTLDANLKPIGPPPKNFKAPVGSAVVQDANTGEIIAMASYPSFDNRWFDGQTPPEKLDQLFGYEKVGTVQTPRNNGPLFNRAVSGTYQIGSTMKLFTSLAAMRYDNVKTGQKVLADPYATFFDIGKWTLPADQCNREEPAGCSKSNAGGAKYGAIDLPIALAVSSDAYFYELGAQLWINTETGSNALQTELRNFGFGKRLGIDLPGEQSGLVPDLEVKKALAKQHIITKFEGSKYFTGDNVNLGIGQGLFGATPLQLVNGYTAFANGGTVFKPGIAHGVWEPGAADSTPGRVDFQKMTVRELVQPTVLNNVELTSSMTKPIHDGFGLVVAQFQTNDRTDPQRSTAADVFKEYDLKGYPIYGKTGTAQTGDQADEKDTSLFVAYGGPASELPRYTIGAVMEQAGFGARSAAPVVKCLFEAVRDTGKLTEPTQSLPLNREQLLPAVIPDPVPGSMDCYKTITFAQTRKVID